MATTDFAAPTTAGETRIPAPGIMHVDWEERVNVERLRRRIGSVEHARHSNRHVPAPCSCST